jgi:uncharacterized protein (TIGR00730 family)
MARICVFCSSSTSIDPRYLELATQVGTAMAGRGHDLVSGGGRVSMMGAVASAVRAGGGHTLGFIPQALMDLEVADTDADELVVTADMRERKGRMDDAADAFLTLPGGLGTIEELSEVWTAAVLGMHAKPVVVLDPGGLFGALRELVTTLESERFMRRDAVETVVWASSVQEALDAIEAGLGNVPARAAVVDALESAPAAGD